MLSLRFRSQSHINYLRFLIVHIITLIIVVKLVPKIFYPEIYLIFDLYPEPRMTKYLQMAKDYCGDISSLINPTLSTLAKYNAKNLDKCDYCEVKRFDPNSTSTENDAAFAFLSGNYSVNLLTWVRTLRSTGCKCSIIFAMTEEFYKIHHSSVIEDLENCGVTIVLVPYMDSSRMKDPRLFARVMYHIFLKFHSHKFDRIMINDIFDTIFQKDPFNSQMPNDKLSLSIERVTFGHNYFNHINLWELYSSDAFSPDWSNRFVINSGFIIGPGKLMNQFHKLVVVNRKFMDDNIIDQSFYNDIIYGKKMTEIFVDFNTTLYASAAYSVYELLPRSDGFLYDWDTKTAPAVIHQADRICPAHSYANEFCPNNNQYYNGTLRKHYIMQQCDQLHNINDREFTDSRNATID